VEADHHERQDRPRREGALCVADVLVVCVVFHRQYRQDASMIEGFEQTSVGAALLRLKAGGTLCDGPLGRHTASDDAIHAGVLETRCLSCRRRIVPSDGGWRAT
jgi:hypothetical protein